MDKKNNLLKKNIFLLLVVIVIAIVPIVLYKDAEFGGADGKAEVVINEIDSSYEPWFSPVFEPPSGEIESLLFVLQGALGAGIVGYYIGYMKGKKKKNI